MKNWKNKLEKLAAVLGMAVCVMTFSAPATSLAQSPARLDKMVVAGWSRPITEITNLLVEEDKGFFKARGIELGYVPGADRRWPVPDTAFHAGTVPGPGAAASA